MLNRLRIKFVCITMAIVTVMLAIVFAMVYYFTNWGLELDSLEMMQQVANRGSPKDSSDAVIPSVTRPYFILSISDDGTITVHESGNFDLSDSAFLKELVNEALSSQKKSGTLREYGFRFFLIDTTKDAPGPGVGNGPKDRPDKPAKDEMHSDQDNDPPKDGPQKTKDFSGDTALIFADTSGEAAVLRSLIFSSLAIGIIILSVFFAVSVLLARWMSKPVGEAMLQQKQFVADASHELKTPLTVILTNAELLRDPAQSHSDRQLCTKNIITMTYQMRGLVEGLLDLAHISEATEEVSFELLDMSTLVSDALLPFDPLFFEQGLILESNICNNVTVKGSKVHLKQLLEILLDNAGKYSHHQSTVRVELTKGLHYCFLRVINRGDEISKGDLTNIFKRFYRIDKARKLGQSHGLGLSIAQQITTNHKGRIWAESSDGENTFTVQLPLH